MQPAPRSHGALSAPLGQGEAVGLAESSLPRSRRLMGQDKPVASHLPPPRKRCWRRSPSSTLGVLLSTALCLLLTLLFLNGSCQAARAGVNAGGVLLLHANTELVFSPDGSSYSGQSGIATCEQVVSQTQLGVVPTVIFAIAAFPTDSSPRISGASFGISYDSELITVLAYGTSADFELPTPDWPAPASGTALTWNAPRTGTAIELYWFAAYSYEHPTTMAMAPHPSQDATLADDAIPAVLDTIAVFGALGFGTPGAVPCPNTLVESQTLEGFDIPSPGGPQPYTVQVLDRRTQRPIPFHKVALEESVTWKHCNDATQHDCEHGCSTYTEHPQHEATTDNQGIVTVYTTEVECSQGTDWWYNIKYHTGWTLHDVVYDEADGSPSSGWNHANTVPQNGGAVDALLYVDRDSDIATRFMPVLHRAARENQSGLADCSATLLSSVLNGYKVTPDGRRIINYSEPMPPVIPENLCGYSAAMEGGEYPEQQWYMDIPNAIRHDGAPDGERPLYYHVFSLGAGQAVVQYWYWLNCNDLADMTVCDAYSHEGDWEHIEVLAVFDPTTQLWDASDVNFYMHECYRTYHAADCWWSTTAAPEYFGLREGYDARHTHPHVWLAARSHGSYNRFADIKKQTYFFGTYEDETDYNISGQPRGAHAFFPYDRLIDLVECWYGPRCNFEAYYYGSGVEFMRSVADFGEYMSTLSDIPGVGGCVFGPKSPGNRSRRWHSWNTHYSYDCDAEFDQPTILQHQYLGEFSTCEDGPMLEPLVFRVLSREGPYPALAHVVTDGSVVFENATGGWLPLREVLEGGRRYFEFSEEYVHGVGRATIGVYVLGTRIAADLVVDFAGDCRNPAGVDNAEGLSAQLRAAPSVTTRDGAVCISWEDGTELKRVEVVDAGGRRVSVGHVEFEPTMKRVVWTATGVPHGVYFVRGVAVDGRTGVARVVVVE